MNENQIVTPFGGKSLVEERLRMQREYEALQKEFASVKRAEHFHPVKEPKTLADKQYAAKRRAKKKISDASKRRNRK